MRVDLQSYLVPKPFSGAVEGENVKRSLLWRLL